MKNSKQKTVISAYGFDKLGFPSPRDVIEDESVQIELIDYMGRESLGNGNGMIIPSGIFESFEKYTDSQFMRQTRVRWDQHHLAEREKEFYNGLRRGNWACFLLGSVWNGRDGRWSDTDLAKKYLNLLFGRIVRHEPTPHILTKSDEFRKYLDEYGISQTSFAEPTGNNDVRVLATGRGMAAAAEINGGIFFLPFLTTKCDGMELGKLLLLLAHSIIDYKKRNDIYLPSWVSAIEFRTEASIRTEMEKVQEKLFQLKEDSERWRKYKGILCTSGQTLNTLVVGILREFFQLALKSEEKHIEDACIFGSDGKVLYVVEIKGVSGGVKRENVNQVDSHRERLGLGEAISGLLVINDFMNIEGLDERKRKQFDHEIMAHAQRTNVKVLRTSTLLEIMLKHEQSPNPKEELLKLLGAAAPMVTVG